MQEKVRTKLGLVYKAGRVTHQRVYKAARVTLRDEVKGGEYGYT